MREVKRLAKQTKRPQQRKQRRDTVDDEAEENVPTESLLLSLGEQTSKDIGIDGRGTTKRKPSSQIRTVWSNFQCLVDYSSLSIETEFQSTSRGN